MHRFIIILFLLLSSYSLMAQGNFLGFRVGLGTYSMKDLKHLQDLRLESAVLPLETTENYPASVNYGVEIGEYLPTFITKWAIGYGFASTGARSTISDYSGRYDLDAVISNHHLGLSLEHDFIKDKNWGFGTYIEAGTIYTRLKTRDYFNLFPPYHMYYNTEYVFLAFGGYVEGGLIVQYQYRFLMARFNLGYFYDKQAGFHLKDNKDAQLYLEGNKLRPQWDGLRVGLQLNILIRNPEKAN
jgi:hypothetical protein